VLACSISVTRSMTSLASSNSFASFCIRAVVELTNKMYFWQRCKHSTPIPRKMIKNLLIKMQKRVKRVYPPLTFIQNHGPSPPLILWINSGTLP
jgi:hypothetical protein